jgi:hypothetical protein
MTNTYRAVSERAKALHDPAEFEAEFTPADERDQLDAGHLEIVPRPYKVLSNNFSAGKQDDTVDLALPVEQEAALIQGGHIERVDKPESKPTSRKKG